MLDEQKADFSNLVFDKHSRKLLSYGRTREEAKNWAIVTVPGIQTEIIWAGVYGRTIWHRNLKLQSARRVLNKVQEESPLPQEP